MAPSATTRRPLKIEVPGHQTVSGILDAPRKPRAAITLAHGAGAGMEHSFMETLASSLAESGLMVLRFNFAYWQRGEKRTDSPDVAAANVAAAFTALVAIAKGLPCFAAGKSFGARMTTTAASRGLLPDLKGIVCFGFPLHTAGKPSRERAKHLAEVKVPILFLQGTRDALADWDLISQVTSELPRASLVEIAGADHGFGVLKRSGRTPEEVVAQLTSETLGFASRPL